MSEKAGGIQAIPDRDFKMGSLFIFALATLFYVFFMHAKHDPALSTVNAFADDPYDAVGTFGIQAAAFLGILCLLRAFRGSHRYAEPREYGHFLLRAQMAAILSVAVTLAADALAMLRHPAVWMGLSAGSKLIELLVAMAIPTIAIGFWVHRNSVTNGWPAGRDTWIQTIIVSVFVVLVLLLYPEHFRRGLIGGLFTVLAGAVVLFLAVWAWTIALVPSHPAFSKSEQTVGSPARRKYGWAVVIFAGVLIGLFFVAGEASEGTGIPHSRLALVISAYVGLETAGVMIGYALLRKPLGLFRGNTH